jgi:hypothetical protein
MRKSVRGALVGATLLPLAVAVPGMAFAGSTGYDEAPKKEHSKDDGDHKDGHHEHSKHDTHHKHEKHEKHEKKEGPLALPETPLDPVLDMVMGDLAVGQDMTLN